MEKDAVFNLALFNNGIHQICDDPKPVGVAATFEDSRSLQEDLGKMEY